MELTFIAIFLGIIAVAESICTILQINRKVMEKSITNLQEVCLNNQKQCTQLSEQLRDERKTYMENRKVMTIEIGLLKQELARAKKEGFQVRPELETEVEVDV